MALHSRLIGKKSSGRPSVNKPSEKMDERKEKLIQRVEAQLKQRIHLEELFSIRWKVV